MRSSHGLCLESWLGQNRCVEGIEGGFMGGYLCSGGDVMNRRAESCVISGFVVDGSGDAVTRNA